MGTFTDQLFQVWSRFLFLFLSCLCPMLGFSAHIQIKTTSNAIKLGETVTVELTYSDVLIPSMVEVRLTGEKLEWFGGDRISLSQESGRIPAIHRYT